MIPDKIPNQIGGKEVFALSGELFDKLDPATGERQRQVARSGAADVNAAVAAAKAAQPAWAATPAVQRGEILHAVANRLAAHREQVGALVAAECGKSPNSGLGETDGAVLLGRFHAGEGQRLYGKTCTSGVADKYALTVRQPVGLAGLIIAANTPIANVAWKVFPALICGNAAILKAAEDAPATAWIFAQIAQQAGLPDGVLNVVQGLGAEAGPPLVDHEEVGVISFTGSARVGAEVAEACGRRLAKVSLELGGKNPFVVCDDADIDRAVHWAALSAYSNAGQRCASGARFIIFDAVYEQFRDAFITAAEQLSLGTTNEDDLGPVINERQLTNMLGAVERAKDAGARILAGGGRGKGSGFYMTPTILDQVDQDSEISVTELFGPIACLYRVADFAEALALANRSPYGLTSAIHTRDFNRAMQFSHKVVAGVAVVNAGTFGSEPHMPFGGPKQSGNGWREPGTEALDVYSELKDIYLWVDPENL